MTLIHLYIGDMPRCLSNTNIPFSNDFHVSYNRKEKELLIRKADHKRNKKKSIYGENIIDLRILAGRNGSGKSTVMNLLGLTRQDRLDEFPQYKDAGFPAAEEGESWNWFALYHLYDDWFALEGYGPYLLGFIENETFYLHHNYSIAFRYDFENNTVIDPGYKVLQDVPAPFRDRNGAADQALDHLFYRYYHLEAENAWFTYKRRYGADRGQGFLFERNYMERPGYEAVCKYLYDAFHDRTFSSLLASTPEGVKIKIELTDRLTADGDILRDEEETRRISRIIYGTPDTVLHMPIPQIQAFFKKKETYSYKQCMVIKYLENMIWAVVRLIQKDEDQEKDNGQKQEKLLYSLEHPYIEPDGTNLETNENGKDQNITNSNITDPNIMNQNEDYLSKAHWYERYRHRKDYLLKYLSELQQVSYEENYESQVLLDPADYENIVDFCESIEKIPDKYFENGKRINVPMAAVGNMNVNFLLPFMAAVDKSEKDGVMIRQKAFLSTTMENLSSGEMLFISFFASLYHGIVKENYHKEGDTCILLLDEPDERFHPEWSRRFIKNLTDLLNTPPFSKYCYQVIIGTHSPLMLSDVPRENICCLKREKKGIEVSQASYGFLSNINDIMLDTFFVESPFGAFAEEYVDRIIKRIRGIEIQAADQGDRFGGQADDLLSELSEMKEDIAIINEPVIQESLKKQIEALQQKLRNHEGAGRTETERLREIERLKARIRELEGEEW